MVVITARKTVCLLHETSGRWVLMIFLESGFPAEAPSWHHHQPATMSQQSAVRWGGTLLSLKAKSLPVNGARRLFILFWHLSATETQSWIFQSSTKKTWLRETSTFRVEIYDFFFSSGVHFHTQPNGPRGFLFVFLLYQHFLRVPRREMRCNLYW